MYAIALRALLVALVRDSQQGYRDQGYVATSDRMATASGQKTVSGFKAFFSIGSFD